MLPLKKSKHAVRASAVLTGSYVAGTVVSVDEHNYMGILVQYTKGDETTMELIVESSIDGGTTYGHQVAVGSPSSGVATVDDFVYQFGATDNYWIDVHPLKADTVKISVKATGGTPTGTCALTAITGWV